MRIAAGLALVPLLGGCPPPSTRDPIVVDAHAHEGGEPRATCSLDLEAAREPTEAEIVRLAMCGGRTIGRAVVEAVAVPPIAVVAVPPATTPLHAWRVRSGEAVITVLARRDADGLHVLASTDSPRARVLPMTTMTIGDHDVVVRERRALPSFRGHARDVLEIEPPGAELDTAVEGAEILVGVHFCEDCHGDGFRPPWTGTLTVARIEPEDGAIVARETWTFSNAKTAERSAFRLERVYRFRSGTLVETPSFDEIARWREVDEGLAREDPR